MNIYNYLYKLSSNAADKLVKDLEDNTPLPSGYITDGYGNIYKIPTHGKTPSVTLDENDKVKYSYNWEDKAIEIYSKVDDSNYDFVTSYNLNPEEFVDGPEYWFKTAAQTVEDEIYNEVDISEAFVEDKEHRIATIEFGYSIVNDMNPDEFHDIILYHYKNNYTYYDSEVIVKSDYGSSSDSQGELNIYSASSIQLSEKDIREIWSDFEDYVTSNQDNVELYIRRILFYD